MPRNTLIVLADLVKAKRPLPVRRIAERTSLSWKTTNQHIKTLEKRGLVKCTNGKRRNYCQVTQRVKDNLGI